MVDLAKIRKKAKKALAGERAGDAPRDEASGESGPAQPAAEKSIAADAGSSTTADAAAVAGASAAGLPPYEPAASALSKLERFKSTAGQQRGSVVRAAIAEEEIESTQLELLTFLLAGEQYAVDIEKIVEIVTPRPVTRIPNADPSVVGIISLRGTIVTLVDVRRKLKHRDGKTAAPDPRVVVVEQEGETVGFQVDRVLRVIKMERSAVEPHPVVHSSEQDEAIRGVFRNGDALTILLDFDKLLEGRSLAGAHA
jgi:purine-binding chemotaxis protein CheW